MKNLIFYPENYPKPIMMFLTVTMVLGILMAGCGGPVATAHIYSKPDGTILYCPEELDPPPTTWAYNGTATMAEDQILEICELE